MPHSWRTHPRTYGKDARYCRVCRNTHGERASLLGFTQTR